MTRLDARVARRLKIFWTPLRTKLATNAGGLEGEGRRVGRLGQPGNRGLVLWGSLLNPCAAVAAFDGLRWTDPLADRICPPWLSAVSP